jgi:hypothetical protein
MGIQRAIRQGATAACISLITVSLFTTAVSAQVLVRGVLYDDVKGTPVQGTVMLVDPASDAAVVHATTDSLGQFSLQAAKGTFQIGAVRAGYKSVLSAPITFLNGERLTIRLPIAEEGDPQHRIGVVEHVKPSVEDAARLEAMRQANVMGGFATRRAVGSGLQYDRSQLEKSMYHTLGEFLQTVPGFRVIDPTSTNSMVMSRNQGLMISNAGTAGGSCRVGWFVDGHRMDMPGRTDPVTDGLGSMGLDAIEGVEIFRGLSEMPSEFAAPDLRCGAVAVWTRRG